MLIPVQNDLILRLGQDYVMNYVLGSPSVGIQSSSPSGSNTIVTLAGSFNPFAVTGTVVIAGAQQSALNGAYTISAVSGMTVTVPATTPGNGPVGGYMLTPIDLTGATLYSQIRDGDDPNSPVWATFTMALGSPPSNGGFTETLLKAAQSNIPYRLAEGYLKDPFWYDTFIVWPSTLTDKVKYGRVTIYPNVTVVG